MSGIPSSKVLLVKGDGNKDGSMFEIEMKDGRKALVAVGGGAIYLSDKSGNAMHYDNISYNEGDKVLNDISMFMGWNW